MFQRKAVYIYAQYLPPFSLIFHFIKIIGTLEQRSIYKKQNLTVRGEDERRSAKERGRGSKPRNALALGLRNVPFSFFPYIKKDSLLPPLEVILSTTDHQIYVGCQHTASGEVIERRADDSKKDRHEITALSELRRKCPQLKTGRRA